MNRFRSIILVARREATERARSRAFIVSTAVTMVVLGGLVAAAVLIKPSTPEYTVALVGTNPPALSESLTTAAGAAGVTITEVAYDDESAARTAVADGTLDAAIVDGNTIVADSEGAGIVIVARNAVQQARFLERLAAAGIDPSILDGVGAIVVDTTGEEDDGTAQGVALATIVLLFLVITTYGQWVMLGVLEEKTTGIAEQVVSAAGVRSLLAGKVIGIGALGLGQLLVLIAAALGVGTLFDLFTLPSSTYAAAAWSIVWFLLGFGFYAVLYAAAASLVSRTEDAQAASMPVVLVSVIAYVVSFSVIPANPDSGWSRIISLIPPASPIAFPARIGFGTVPVWELLLGVALTAAATYGVIRLAARIYAGGLLAGGGRVKVRQAWKAAGELVGR